MKKRTEKRRDLVSNRRDDDDERRALDRRDEKERRSCFCPTCDTELTPESYCNKCGSKVIIIREDED